MPVSVLHDGAFARAELLETNRPVRVHEVKCTVEQTLEVLNRLITSGGEEAVTFQLLMALKRDFEELARQHLMERMVMGWRALRPLRVNLRKKAV